MLLYLAAEAPSGPVALGHQIAQRGPYRPRDDPEE